MTVVEAALQGRLHHISRRPHDKERAEMLTSGTVLVYEENASGIKRWTDAVHWSPSRVMNNCLIYRQLVRALKPEEKKTALNPSCGTKRKRKESAGPAVTKTGDNISEDEYEGALDDDATGKVYANFAQSLSPDQQRRFCGSLIDSYEFKEGGLMKKTISVKYQGTHHHVISYYSLEDVVSGKLKRPFQDPQLATIQPRPELLAGWKVSLEDEESKDMPLAGYSQHLPGHPAQMAQMAQVPGPSHSTHLPPSHLQHVAVSQGVGVQAHAPLLHVPEYWHSPAQYQSSYAQSPSYQYQSQYAPPSPQPYSPHSQYPAYTRHYSFDHPTQYTVPSAPTFDLHVVPPSASVQSQSVQSVQSQSQSVQSVQSQSQSVQSASVQSQSAAVQSAQSAPVHQHHHDQQRRASAPVALQPYSGYPAPPSYYVEDHKYAPGSHRYQ
jgi:hypothetical protein